MNLSSTSRIFHAGQSTLILLIVFTVIALIFSLFSLVSGWLGIFQNIFYFPIIIACVYYLKRGFAFSVLLAGIYLGLILAFSPDEHIIKGAVIRVLFFILVAAVVTRLSILRISAEEALRESEERYSSLFYKNHSVALLIDPETSMIVDANIAACTFYGYRYEELTSRSICDLNRLGQKKVLEDLSRSKAEGEKHFYTTHYLSDGQQRDIEVFTGPIMVKGTLLFYSIIHDITDRRVAEEGIRRSEQLLAGIIDHLPDATLVINQAGEALAWNRAMEDLTGVNAAKIVGKGNYEYAIPFYGTRRPILVDLLLSEDKEVVKNYQSVRWEGSALLAETVYASPKGRTVTLWGKASALYDKDGNISGAIESIRDISDRKQTEYALRQANRQLNLMSGITRHDILNKILIVRGYQEIIAEITTDPVIQRYIKEQDEAIRTIERQIAFTRIYQDLGTQDPQWQQIRVILEKLDIPETITMNILIEDIEIYADALLELVFYNLLDNSLKHGQGLTSIRVSTVIEPEHLKIIWEDDGIGIAATDKEHIFNRGYGKNSGLGLFFIREILSITGIIIHETGEPGKGARFEITMEPGIYRIVPGKK